MAMHALPDRDQEVGPAPAGSANRCSLAAREAHLDPGGTAASFEVLVLVERPLPWPSDVGDAPDIAEVISAVAGVVGDRRFRVQTVLGVGHEAAGGRRRVLCYERRPDLFDGFEGAELEVAADQVAAAAQALVARDGRLAGAAAPIGLSDLLICGHGARDRCCGSFGTRLALGLAAGGLPDDVRLWRTSHTGGHRFAPTAVVLPYGDVWGNLDENALLAILRRDTEPAEVLHLYRGSAGMPSPSTQLLDRFALGVEGWAWRSRGRAVREERLGDGTVRVRIDDGDGVVAIEGIVRTKRTFPLAACGAPSGALGKPVEELELLAVVYPGIGGSAPA